MKRERREQEEEEEKEEITERALNLHFNAIRRTAFYEIVTRSKTKSCAPVLIKRRFINNCFSSVRYCDRITFIFFKLSLLF